jgi:hypothetical protein
MGLLAEAVRDTEEANYLKFMVNLFALCPDSEVRPVLRYFRTAFGGGDEDALTGSLIPLDERPGAKLFLASLFKNGVEDLTSESADALLLTQAVLLNMPAPEDTEWIAELSRRIDMAQRNAPPTKTTAEYQAELEEKLTSGGSTAEDALSVLGVLGAVELGSQVIRSRVGQRVITQGGGRLASLAIASRSGALQSAGRFLGGLTSTVSRSAGTAAAAGLGVRGALARGASLLSKFGPVGIGAAVGIYALLALADNEDEVKAVDDIAND